MTTIFTTQVPATNNIDDPKCYGVAFTCSVSGRSATAVRYWNATSNLDGYSFAVGLWDASGTLVGSGARTQATGEPVGWVSVPLDTPVPLTASAVYTAGYFVPVRVGSNVNLTDTELTSSVSNPPLASEANGGRWSAVTASLIEPTNASSGNFYADVDVSAAGLSVAAGADQSVISGSSANLIGGASGGSGTKVYAWTKTSGPAGTFSAASSSSTSFTPTGGSGTYVLRLTVTDDSGSAFDELTLTVSTAGLTANPVSAVTTGWTIVGSSAVAALSDTDNGTYAQATGPSNLVLDVTLGPIQAPAGGQDWTARIDAQKLTATTGTLVGKLYNGATLIATAPSVNITDTITSVDCVFAAADIASMPAGTWASGVRVTLTANAT